MLGHGLNIWHPSRGEGAPPIITQTVAPSFGPYVAGNTPAGVYTAGTYASTAGTISSAVASWTVNGVSVPGSTVLAGGDVVGLTVLVTDSAANTRTFGYGASTTAATAPAAFTAGQWTLADSPSAGGDTLTINVTALPADGGSSITALQYRVNGGSAVTMSGTGTGTRQITVPALASANVEIRAVNVVGNSAWSDTKAATPTVAATVPAAFTVGQWTLADSPSAGGDTLTLTISALPSDGGSAITALQYRRNGGAATTLSGTGTGARQITVLATTAANIEIRAVNAIGNGAWSDTKTATPTVSSGTAALFSSVNADGWSSTYTSPPTFTPNTSPEVFTVTRQGYTTAGATTTYTEDLICTQRIRQPYPNEASLTTNQVALSDFIYSTDTVLGATNNSTEVSPKPVAQWGLPDRVIVGNTIAGEILAFHRNGVAAVEVRATDGTNTVTTMVSALTVSTQPGDKTAVLVYAFSLDITTLADNTNITVNAKVFPRIGAAASVLDSNDLTLLYNFSPRVYRKNTSRASAPPIVYVAAGGNDTTGAVSTNDATASASPCLTLTGAINRARTVLGTATGSLDGLRVRMTAGTWSLASNPTANTVNTAIIVEPGTGVAKADAIFEFGTVNATFAITYVRFGAARLRRTGAFYPYNTATGHCVFENCDLDLNGNTGALAGSASVFFFVGTTITGVGASVLGAGSPIFALLRGCAFGAANINASLEPNAIIGCDIKGCRTVAGTRDLSGGMVAFNKFMQSGNTSGGVLNLNPTADINGYAVVQNLLEFTSATSNAAFGPSSDNAACNTTHFIAWHNTFAGFAAFGRSNVLYDDTNADLRTHKLHSLVGNIHTQINFKADVFKLDGTRVGAWSYNYGVGARNEFSRYLDAGGGSWKQDFPGMNASIGTASTGAGNDPLFVDYEGTTTSSTAGAGLGNYALQSGSPAKARGVPALPRDLTGALRSATLSSSGAYE